MVESESVHILEGWCYLVKEAKILQQRESLGAVCVLMSFQRVAKPE